ncbi:hypothetical protein CEXT_399721 [Caerostris extrusa]|uniref:Uncharacterized protein n=1 Tax=Caerostris extrusa TaxID=172846 RepID=A0AAV4QAJ5_CAEEX|nr:hypothetical protein CEXT_399721 [Caerostris extrusa]
MVHCAACRVELQRLSSFSDSASCPFCKSMPSRQAKIYGWKTDCYRRNDPNPALKTQAASSLNLPGLFPLTYVRSSQFHFPHFTTSRLFVSRNEIENASTVGWSGTKGSLELNFRGPNELFLGRRVW